MGGPKTIRAVKPGGWAKRHVPQAAELAQLDEQLSTYGLDCAGVDTITGTLSLQGSNWTFPAGAVLLLDGGAATVETRNGGRISLQDGDFPTYSAPRARMVMISALEGKPNFGTDRWQVDATTGGVQGLLPTQFLTFPIPKLHDGATLSSVTAYFIVSRLQGSLPATFPTVTVFRQAYASAPALQVLGVVSMASPGTLSAYQNGGAPQPLVCSCPANNVIDIAAYRYAIQITDDDTTAPNKVVWKGFKLNYTAINDQRWHQ